MAFGRFSADLKQLLQQTSVLSPTKPPIMTGKVKQFWHFLDNFNQQLRKLRLVPFRLSISSFWVIWCVVNGLDIGGLKDFLFGLGCEAWIDTKTPFSFHFLLSSSLSLPTPISLLWLCVVFLHPSVIYRSSASFSLLALRVLSIGHLSVFISLAHPWLCVFLSIHRFSVFFSPLALRVFSIHRHMTGGSGTHVTGVVG